MKTLITMLALTTFFYCSFASKAQTLNPNSMSVTIENEDGMVNLKWQTQREINTRYFNIERSTDGINFIKIGTVNASSSSMFPRSYEFNDVLSADNSKNYTYRVVLVNMDGLAVVSNSVNFNQNIEDTTVSNIAQE